MAETMVPPARSDRRHLSVLVAPGLAERHEGGRWVLLHDRSERPLGPARCRHHHQAAVDVACRSGVDWTAPAGLLLRSGRLGAVGERLARLASCQRRLQAVPCAHLLRSGATENSRTDSVGPSKLA